MYNVLRKHEGAKQLWRQMALIRRLGPLSKPSKLLQTILLETLNHQISPLLRLPRSLRFRIYDFVLDVPYSDALLSNLNHKDEIHIEWDPYKFYPVTRACRQLRKEMHPLFLQTTRRLWFQFDYMPITCGYLWRALKDFLPYIQALQVSFFPHLSRLLALLPSLKGILIETPEHTSYADSWVPWKQFEELAFEGDAPALELGDRILKRFGHYQIVNISIDFSVVTTRHEEMYHITGENDEFCRIKGRSGPMDKLGLTLDLTDRVVLWKQFCTTGRQLLFGSRWENEFSRKSTFEHFIAKIEPEDQQLGFRPTGSDFPRPINWKLP